MTHTSNLAMDVLNHLRQLEAKGSPGLAARVLDVFLRDTSLRLSSLREAMTTRDRDALQRLAHTLQGSAAMVGAPSVAHQCAELIECAACGDFDRCEVIVSALAASLQTIQRAVTD